MKKLLCCAVCTLAAAVFAADGNVKLPAPDKTGGKPLMQTLTERKTIRKYSAKELSGKEISNILYAAWGINRPEKNLRTVPTAMNRQNMRVYLTSGNGTFLYHAEKNELEKVSGEDLRKYSNYSPELGLSAPVSLIYAGQVTDKMPETLAFAHAGSAYQNVYLYCASAGLGTVICASTKVNEVAKALKLKDGWKVLCAQVIGYPE